MDRTASGWINGFVGMLIFSFSLPGTRAAVADFDPLFLTAGRGAIAGSIGLALILALAAMLLREPVGSGMIGVTLAVVARVGGARHFSKESPAR